MKKLLAIIMVLAFAILAVACAAPCTDHVDSNGDGKCDVCEAPVEKKPCDECKDEDNDGKCDECGKDVEATKPGDGIMTYAEYVAAELNAPVKVKTYVQAKQSWWDNKGTFYTAAPEGAYFLYNMPCTEEQYNALVPGTCIIVSGYKSAYAGEVEIIDATYEIVADDTYIATATDFTAKFAEKADLLPYQNSYFSVNGAIVMTAPMYKWDGTGSEGDDIYVTVSLGGNAYTFVVESYLHGNGSDVYETVEALEIGDVITVEAFLYWYNGAQPHVNDVEVTSESTVSSYEEYIAAELNTEHTVVTYVQAKQSWWQDKGTFYTQSPEGAYFLYNMPCTEDFYNQLVPGTCIMVTGYKGAYAGEIELIDISAVSILGSGYVAKANDLTETFKSGEGIDAHQNEYIALKGATVSAAPKYNWDGTGSEGNDIYIGVTIGEKTYTIVVESYLHGNGSDVYEAAEALKVGDVIDVEAFLYWYNGAQPHINVIVKK